MSHRNIVSGRDILLDSVSEDLRVKNDLYVGNNIYNDKLLARIEKIENDIASIKSVLSSITSESSLSEIKQSLADIYEIINPQ